MVDRKTWVGFAALALLSSGCEMCKGARIASGLAADPEFRRYGSMGPPVEQPAALLDNGSASEAPTPGNVLAGFTSNKFECWTISHRVDVPVEPKLAP